MDIIHDNSHRTLIKIDAEIGLPDYVRATEAPTKEAAEKLADAEYADSTRRLFPIDSKENVWLSAAYFNENADDIYKNAEEREWVLGEIKSAAELYGNAEEVENIFLPIQTKQASAADDPSNYCWTEGGLKEYPVFDAEGVKCAMDYYERNYVHYKMDKRVPLARNIIKKANDYNIAPSDELLKEAGYGIPNRNTLM